MALQPEHTDIQQITAITEDMENLIKKMEETTICEQDRGSIKIQHFAISLSEMRKVYAYFSTYVLNA